MSIIYKLEELNGLRKEHGRYFTIWQITEKCREFNPETHIPFLDYGKGADRINRAILWQIMERRGYPSHLMHSIKSYQNTTIILHMEKDTQRISKSPTKYKMAVVYPTLCNI
jgi:hypothetical protein